jgi:hypothetical protein
MVFASGFAGLAMQVAWFREFRLVFGASTAASGAVLAMLIALLGVGSGFVTDLLGSLYLALGGQSVLGFTGATFARLALAAVVLGPATVCMGGTLPAAVKAVTLPDDRQRRAAAVLYGLNTLGAVLGALVATFVLLQLLGTRATLVTACIVYSTAAAVAYRWTEKEAKQGAGMDSQRVGVPPLGGSSRPAKAGTPTGQVDAKGTVPSGVVYAAAGVTGFTFFLMELVWYRMLGPILGGTTYTFGLILAVALLGIGAGGALYPLVVRVLKPGPLGLATTCAVQAACMAAPLALGDSVALWAAQLSNVEGGFLGAVLGWSAIAALVVLPASLVAGFQFPLLVAMAGSADRHIGKQVGYTFAANTLGAILGSLAGGFGLLPWLTAPGAWRLAVVLLVLLALAAMAVASRVGWVVPAVRAAGFTHAKPSPSSLSWLVPLATVALAVALLSAEGPTAVWRHAGIGAGRFALPEGGQRELQNWMHAQRRFVLWEAEGVEASIAMLATNGLSFLINGKSDGHAIGDAGTQIMLGLLPAALHLRPETALVVGLGTGETAGWLAEVRSMERVDVVELEPAIAEVARRCALVNHDAMYHLRVRVIYNDAREVLLTMRDRYDLIVSEPSNPWRAGIANLFTHEFYQASRGRLNEGGLFVQWLQGYEVDAETVTATLATLRSVFGHVEVWQSKAEDTLLVCSVEPIAFDAARVRERIAVEPWRSGLKYAWRATDLEGLLARFVAGPQLADRVAAAPGAIINTDDRNVIEYGFARTLGRTVAGFSIAALREEAIAMDAHRPVVAPGAVDWRRVEDHRQMMIALAGGTVAAPPDPTPEQLARTEVLGRYWQGDAAGMVAAWQAAAYEPLYPTETTLLALALADLGDDRARPLLERLAEYDRTEAEVIQTHLLVRQGRYREAAERMERVLIALRTHPWCLSHVLEMVFPDVVELAAREPALATRLYAALGHPFAVYLHEEDRLRAAHAVAGLLGTEAVVETLQAFEPHVPWDEAFLANRYRVYEAAGHPFTHRARSDLEAFLRQR